MADQFDMFARPILPASDNAISLPGSAGGPTPAALQESPTIIRSGAGRARASRSRLQGASAGLPTNAISGPSSSASSPSAALQSLLGSRLAALLDVNGSPEFVLTWKAQDMPAGAPIFRLAASARRTSGPGCSGAASGWPTPKSSDERGGMPARFKGADSLNGRRSNLNDAMTAAVVRSGPKLPGSPATTAKRGVPSPAFPCWLMGYPAEWLWNAPAPKRAKSAARPHGAVSATP